MFDRDRGRTARRPARRPQAEALECRQLLVATLSPIGPVSVPLGLGFQVPLDGGTGRPQTYAVTSDNAAIRAAVARGQFLTIGVTHASSGVGDPGFSGTLTFQLFEDLTPLTAARIESLVSQGFYTAPTTGNTFPSKPFHRVAANFPGATDFIVQGGSVNGNGTGLVNQPGFPFDDEFVEQLAFTGSGQLAMANAGDDTNSSQFFITTGSPRFLDFNFTIFGQLVDGRATLAQMTQVARDASDTPLSPILTTSTTLSPVGPDGVIHIDATTAAAGQAGTVTVTATDPADNTTATQTFQVSVVADPNNNGRPFLGPIGDQIVGVNGTATFQLTVVDPGPTNPLTFFVAGGINRATGVFTTQVQNATASFDNNGRVTVRPNAGFTGTINLVVAVSGQIFPEIVVGSYDTQQITLTVTNNTAPTADPVAASTPPNAAAPIQLTGNPRDPGQTLSFVIDAQPANGTISNFNAQTGTLTYTPRVNFVGSDTFTYRVRDVGEPTPNLTSGPATVTVTVSPGLSPTVLSVAPIGARTITGVDLSFSGPLDVARASDRANYAFVALGADGRPGTRDDRRIGVRSVAYDPMTGNLTVVPDRPLRGNQFTQLVVNAAAPGGLADPAGNLLDGDGDGVAGGNVSVSFARAPQLRYPDRNGDIVTLQLARGGVLDLIRAADGEGRALRLLSPVPGRSVLTGSVRRPRRTGDGTTTLGTLTVPGSLATIRSRLRTPPFFIGQIVPQGVDALLARGESFVGRRISRLRRS
jgi:cyclophilin family peptidyl-prolyl cis-trans isomerase